jgi:5-dehydro-4-deoxyglucarate dehydratase
MFFKDVKQMDLSGLLFFPVTPFSPAGDVDASALAAHVSERIDDGAACVFAACGTGEFHALGIEEHRLITRTSVDAAGGRVPVFVGVGGSVSTAQQLAHTAEEEGASGILLLPPYLVAAPQQGLLDYVSAVAGTTELPVIVYQRGEMRLTADSVVTLTRTRNIIGLKDGVGNISEMQLIVSAVRGTGNDDFLFFNGLPTAELTMKAYQAIGVPLYSSAVFAFAPDIALEFHTALTGGDTTEVDRLLREFFVPFVKLRDRQQGYQVSLVKAAVKARDQGVGGVRPPLVDPTPADVDELNALLASVRDRRRTPATVGSAE